MEGFKRGTGDSPEGPGEGAGSSGGFEDALHLAQAVTLAQVAHHRQAHPVGSPGVPSLLSGPKQTINLVQGGESFPGVQGGTPERFRGVGGVALFLVGGQALVEPHRHVVLGQRVDQGVGVFVVERAGVVGGRSVGPVQQVDLAVEDPTAPGRGFNDLPELPRRIDDEGDRDVREVRQIPSDLTVRLHESMVELIRQSGRKPGRDENVKVAVGVALEIDAGKLSGALAKASHVGMDFVVSEAGGRPSTEVVGPFEVVGRVVDFAQDELNRGGGAAVLGVRTEQSERFSVMLTVVGVQGPRDRLGGGRKPGFGIRHPGEEDPAAQREKDRRHGENDHAKNLHDNLKSKVEGSGAPARWIPFPSSPGPVFRPDHGVGARGPRSPEYATR